MSQKHRAPADRGPVEVRRRAARRAGAVVALAAASAAALSLWAARPGADRLDPAAPQTASQTTSQTTSQSAPASAPERSAAEAAEQDTPKRGDAVRYRPVGDPQAGPRAAAVYREVPAEQLVEELLERAGAQLTPEEEDLVRLYDAEGPGAIVAQTEYELLHAEDAERAEKQRRYTLALNLVPKLEGSEPDEPSPERMAEQQRYLEELAARRREWARLPAEERARREADLKDRMLAQTEPQPDVYTEDHPLDHAESK